MGILNVTTIKSLEDVAPVIQNAAGTEVGRHVRAFVRFGGGSATIASSFNVSSVTDLGQGDYNVVFTNSFSDANYCFTLGHDGAVNTGHSPHMHAYLTNRNAPLSNLLHLRCYHPMDSAKRSDGNRMCVAIF